MDILGLIQGLKKDASKRSSSEWCQERERMLDADADLEELIAELTAAHGAALLEKGPQEVRAIESKLADANLQRQRVKAAIPQLDRSIVEAELRELTAEVDACDAARQKHRARAKQIDIELHDQLERAAACMGELLVAERAFKDANAFCVANGRESLLSPRELLGTMIYQQGQADGTFARPDIPTTILGYFPRPTCEPARNLSRMTEISLPR